MDISFYNINVPMNEGILLQMTISKIYLEQLALIQQ